MTKKEIMQTIEGTETLIELDNVMEILGFSSVFDEVDETTLKNNGSVSYLIPGTDSDYINICFKENGEKIKIIAVEEI